MVGPSIFSTHQFSSLLSPSATKLPLSLFLASTSLSTPTPAPAELEKRKHKLKRLVQSPNSFFMKYGIGYSKLGSNIIF
jgi:hypothetical protein